MNITEARMHYHRHWIPLMFVVVVCVLSIRLSASYFTSALHPQTAHVLTSLRALDEWGFFALRGASVIAPYTPELEDVNPRAFTADDAMTYLSYPSGWLVFPYVALSSVRIATPGLQVSPAFLQSYNVLVNRCITAFLLYALFFVFLSHLFPLKLTQRTLQLCAVIGVIAWIFSIPTLYWTQNSYGMDQAIVPVITALLLWFAYHKMRLDTATFISRIFLGFLVFCATFIDWYGWVFVGVAAGIVISVGIVSGAIRSVRSFAHTVLPMICGSAITACITIIQIFAYTDGWKLATIKYERRSQLPDNIFSFLETQWHRWIEYVPFSSWIVVAGSVLLIIFSMWRLRQSSVHLRVSLVQWALLILPPLVWTMLLPQHTAEHEFSMLKFSLPTAWLISCAAASVVLLYPQKKYSAIFLVICSFIFIVFAMFFRRENVLAAGGDADAVSLAALVSSFDQNDLLIADDGVISAGWPMQRRWRANRRIYRMGHLHSLINRNLINIDNLSRMHPVYLSVTNDSRFFNVSRRCRDVWVDTSFEIQAKRIYACRTDTLREIYDPILSRGRPR